jgi:hypothetical protein
MKTETWIMNENGLMEKAQNMPPLPYGTKIYAFGGGMAESIWAVCSEANPKGDYQVVKISKHYDDDYFSHPIGTLESYSRPIEKKFGIGFYYSLSETPFTKDEVSEALQRADATIKRQAQAEQDQRDADVKEIAELPAMFPYLTPLTDRHSQKETKANLVAMLKHKFPKVKFSVKKRNYDSYYVTWVDGPAVEQIKDVGRMFESHETDETGDYRDYNPSNFNRVFGGFKYVFEERDYSEAIERMKDEAEWEDKRLINSQLYEMDIPVYTSVKFENGKVVFEVAEVVETPLSVDAPEVSSDIQIVDYSEKSVQIIGDTKPYADKLKRIGVWNKHKKCWFISKSKLTELSEILSNSDEC